MKKINPKDIKIGEFIYIIDKVEKYRRYILKKILNKKEEKFEWWMLEKKPEKTHLFEMTQIEGITDMDDDKGKDMAFGFYITYKLNKKEISEFNKLLILKNL